MFVRFYTFMKIVTILIGVDNDYLAYYDESIRERFKSCENCILITFIAFNYLIVFWLQNSHEKVALVAPLL